MHILVIILLTLAGIIVLLLVLALFMRKEYNVRSEVVINVPSPAAFDYIKHLKNQDYFNKWILRDPNMTRIFTGTDGTVGFVYAWKDNKGSGEGQQKITGLAEGSRVEIELRFIKPLVAVGHVVFTTEPISASQTRVTWSNKSSLKYPLNIMVPVVEKLLPKDMTESLNNLKAILEK